MIGEAPRAAFEVVVFQEDRRSRAYACRFRENGHDVVALRRRAITAVPPVVVLRVGQDTSTARGGQIVRHVRTDEQDSLAQARIEVGVQRVEERRHEDARARGPI